MKTRVASLVLAVCLLLVSPEAYAGLDQSKKPADDFPSDVVWVWFDTLYDVIKSEATSPPAASRIYGVVAVTLYEAIAPGARHGRSLVGQLNDLSSVPRPKRNTQHHWPTVANAALAQTIRGIFPSLKPDNLNAVEALEARFGARFQGTVPRPDWSVRRPGDPQPAAVQAVSVQFVLAERGPSESREHVGSHRGGAPATSGWRR